MPVRAAMAGLIGRVRQEVGDEGVTKTFTDQEVQDVLDRFRRDVKYAWLTASWSIAPGGAVTYSDFYSPIGGNWESDAALVDGSYNVLTANSSDPLVGIWTFSPGRTTMDVAIVGRQYDVYATCEELCSRWVSKLKLDYAFSSGGRTRQRKERIDNLVALQKRFQGLKWVGTGQLVRTDMYPTRRGGIGLW
jgi:hypothetical protein